MSDSKDCLGRCCAAELIGTFLLVFIGCGAVHVAVTLGALEGVWQVASMWGFAVALAIYAIGNISGAHINPAITVAMACFGGFSKSRVVPYILAQLVGAFLAACALYVIFSGSISAYEAANDIVRGARGSEVTASMYGEFFPNPTVGLHGSGEDAKIENLSTGSAAFAEILGTAILAFCVCAFTDGRNKGSPGDRMAPFFIGMTVAVLIGVLGPLTQACLNPARDFGPRLFSSMAGWGGVAWTGEVGIGPILLVYLVSPILGAVGGAALYTKVIGPSQPSED